MFQLRTTGCCGMLEIEDMSSQPGPQEVLDGIIPKLRANCNGWLREKPFVLFTSVVQRVVADHVDASGTRDDDYGLAFADFLEQGNYGTVIRTLEPQRNYTKNLIKIWVWLPNYDTLRATYPIPMDDSSADICNCEGCQDARRFYNTPVPEATSFEVSGVPISAEP